MMTDKTKTPQKIFLQENYGKQEYGVGQDDNVCGMVRYFRCDEDYNKIKKVLAMALMDYLDNNRSQGKMCLSNGECKNIDDAFDLGNWDMIFRYIEKYTKNSYESKCTIEYTRTDIFIEKARKWFEMQNEGIDFFGNYKCDMTDFEDFKSYMKRE